MALTYEPLDVDSYEIRILIILPDPPESAVRCTLEKFSLLNPVPYTALSYCWGDPNITTDIHVNGSKTPITTNLADALQYLRKIGVYRCWADAICICQTDKQEKGLQVRNMMEIFSRAERTYGWIGREDGDGTTSAMAFLQSLLNSHDDMALIQPTHTCVLTTQQQRRASSVHSSPSDVGLQYGGCTRCANESHFQGLRHLLQREYWRRRWIIQETSVPYEVIILCGDTAMALDGIIKAIFKCRGSSYWNSGTEDIFSCLKSIANFRRLYQRGTRLSLCKAITLTQHFQSSQPIDAIFSLLGLSSDGPWLVPTPNYLQPIEMIVAKLTFALIQRDKHLDYLLINSRNRLSSEGFPSWSPNWLSKDLSLHDPREVRFDSRFLLGKSVGQLSLMGGKVLRVKGFAVGNIITNTTSTGPADMTLLHSSQSASLVLLSESSIHINRYSTQEALLALLSCFKMPRNQHISFPATKWSKWKPWSIEKDARSSWHYFCLRCVRPGKSNSIQLNYTSGDYEVSELQSKSLFSQWLKANARFHVHGRSLEEWTQERKLYPSFSNLLRVLDIGPYTERCNLLVEFFFIGCLVIISCLYAGRIIQISQVDLGMILSFIIVFASINAYLSMLSVSYHQQQRLWSFTKRVRWDNLTHLMKPGKKLFVTDKGFVGMADDRAMIGDKLCYLVGCSTAVVLRETAEESSAGAGGNGGSGNVVGMTQRKQYTVVGECFIHFLDKEVYHYLGPVPPTMRDSESEEDWLRERTLEEFHLI
ncbi:hypothetical protein MMC18_009573 [Xylographa bjoerkii]|nr:hypothetical protein [Xylographa bjoerkii]